MDPAIVITKSLIGGLGIMQEYYTEIPMGLCVCVCVCVCKIASSMYRPLPVFQCYVKNWVVLGNEVININNPIITH